MPEFRSALVSNLRQEPGREFPLAFLDPQFSWHPGARYFRTRFHWLAMAIAENKTCSYRQALSEIARRVCVLQLVPYHSAVFALPRRMLDGLQSTALAKAFVREHLPSRSSVLVIATRKADHWALPERSNIVCYEGSETRAAHLSPGSRGGKELASHFGVPANHQLHRNAR